jgi:hypothetical protein
MGDSIGISQNDWENSKSLNSNDKGKYVQHCFKPKSPRRSTARACTHCHVRRIPARKQGAYQVHAVMFIVDECSMFHRCHIVSATAAQNLHLMSINQHGKPAAMHNRASVSLRPVQDT